MTDSTCSAEHCTRAPWQKGMCSMHYNRARRHGDPLAGGPTRRPASADPASWFWSLTQRVPNGCLEWQRRRNSAGYGRYDLNGETLAHRIAWGLTHGPIPKGMFVLHRCDNPPCCDPDHLWLGSNADNVQDMIDKGRHTRKVSPADVLRLRAMRDGGALWREVAAAYGLSIGGAWDAYHSKTI